jgi:hypothetical protein
LGKFLEMIKFKKIVDGEFTIFEVTGVKGDTIKIDVDTERERDKVACAWYYVTGLTNTFSNDGKLYAERYPGTFSRELETLPKGSYDNLIVEDILYYCMSRTDKQLLSIDIFRKSNAETFTVKKSNHLFVASGLVTLHTANRVVDVAGPAIINIKNEDVTVTSRGNSVSFRLK